MRSRLGSNGTLGQRAESARTRDTADAPPLLADSAEKRAQPVEALHDPASSDPDQHLQLLLGVVDAIDGMTLRKTRLPEAGQAALTAVQHQLSDLLELCGAELIQESTWQPELQRAVKIELPEDGQTETRCLKSLGTGLRVSGRIVRKQNVVISRPQPLPPS